jgi:hypothetical protein
VISNGTVPLSKFDKFDILCHLCSHFCRKKKYIAIVEIRLGLTFGLSDLRFPKKRITEVAFPTEVALASRLPIICIEIENLQS